MVYKKGFDALRKRSVVTAVMLTLVFTYTRPLLSSLSSVSHYTLKLCYGGTV